MTTPAAFQLKNVRRLPDASRTIALDACLPHCPAHVFNRFIELWNDASTQHRVLLLPVLWTALDPAGIPSHDELEELSTNAELSMLRAFSALSVLADPHCHVPEETVVDLWPRAFAWVDSVDLHYNLFPDDVQDAMPPRVVWLTDFVSFTRNLHLQWNCERVGPLRFTDPSHLETPGFLLLLIEAWEAAVWAAEMGEDSYLPEIEKCCALLPPAVTSAQWQVVLNGVDGTVDGFVELVQRHLRVSRPYLLIRPGAPILAGKLFLLHLHALDFVRQMDAVAPASEDNILLALATSNGHKEVLDSLGELLAVPSSQRSRPERATTITRMVATVSNIGGAGPKAVKRALSNGLLARILSSSAQTRGSSMVKAASRILTELRRSFLRPRVLGVLSGAVAEVVDDASIMALLPAAPIYTQWLEFTESAAQHGRLLTAFESRRPSQRRRACDNPLCGVIGKKSSFRRCAGCKTRIYCSKKCQARDWDDGDHRSCCSTDLVFYKDLRSIFSARDIAFLRFVLTDYCAQFCAHVHCTGAAALRRNPPPIPRSGSPDPLVMTFSFEHGVLSAGSGRALRPELAARFPWRFRANLPIIQDWVRRVHRSKGKIVLHAIHLATGVGNETRTILLPMRRRSQFLETTAQELARKMPPSTVKAEDMVWDFDRVQVPKTEDLFFIHQ